MVLRVHRAIQVFLISSGLSSSRDYARFEALAIKMRQAESFFGAAPEALIQLTVLLVAEEQELTLNRENFAPSTKKFNNTNRFHCLSNKFSCFVVSRIFRNHHRHFVRHYTQRGEYVRTFVKLLSAFSHLWPRRLETAPLGILAKVHPIFPCIFLHR